jgi:CRISPR/Cas system CMR subunit Cmr6 (Cas7 group RAMP superfamily)
MEEEVTLTFMMNNSKLEVLEERMKNLEKQNSLDHKIILDKIDRIWKNLNNLSKYYATKEELEFVDGRVKSIEMIVKWVSFAVMGALIAYSFNVIVSHGLIK